MVPVLALNDSEEWVNYCLQNLVLRSPSSYATIPMLQMKIVKF